jgi:hypothetical protein
MLIVDTLAQAQKGKMVERVAAATGLSPSDARKALEAICPSIAARIHEGAADRRTFDELLAILDDNQGDLLDDGDVGAGDVAQDGEVVLGTAYGSLAAAEAEAQTVARALRLDAGAMAKLAPIAAAIVLAILGRRYQEVAGAEDETAPEPETQPEPAAGPDPSPSSRGILATVLVTAGTAAARAIVNRMMPRRRRRTYSYDYSYVRVRRRRRTRRRRSRTPTLNDLFRGLLK